MKEIPGLYDECRVYDMEIRWNGFVAWAWTYKGWMNDTYIGDFCYCLGGIMYNWIGSHTILAW